MVWSIAIANILGSGICFVFSGQLAKLATLRYTLITPIVLSLIYIGAFEATRNWGDLYSLLFFGLLGWAMKHFQWPRPPLILGVVIGGIIERYMFISIERYGAQWMWRPIVMGMFALSIVTLTRPLLQGIREHHGIKDVLSSFGRPRLTTDNLFPAALLSLIVVMLAMSVDWPFEAKIIPTIVSVIAIIACSLSLANDILSKGHGEGGAALADMTKSGATQKIHMDIASKTGHLPGVVVLVRGFVFFGWLVGFLCSMATIGLLPTVPLFVGAYMRVEGREQWRHIIIAAVIMTALIYIVFDQLLSLPWPPTLIGEWFPVLKAYIPSV